MMHLISKGSVVLSNHVFVFFTAEISTVTAAAADNVTDPAFKPLNATNDERTYTYMHVCIGQLKVNVVRFVFDCLRLYICA